MASSSSPIPPRTATCEIDPAEDADWIQIPATHEDFNKENGKSTSREVSDHSENRNSSGLFKSLRRLLGSKQENSKPRSIAKEPTENNGPNPDDNKEDIRNESQALSNLIEADLHFIHNASVRITEHQKEIDEVKKTFDKLKNGNAEDLRKLKKVVKTLKQQISTKKKDESKESDLSQQLDAICSGTENRMKASKLGEMPNLFEDPDFEKTLQFKDFEALYNELSIEKKLCLLSFSVFPENAEIKKRVMIYWWIGEGFVPPIVNPGGKKPEQWATEYFNELIKKGFIESALKKPSPKVETCRMHPFVRLMVNKLAQRNTFLEFDGEGNANEVYSKSLRACLLNGKELIDKELIGKELTGKELIGKELEVENYQKKLEVEYQKKLERLQNLHAMFNVNEEILDFNHELFSKMKNMNVLYLGRWQSAAAHHIEVDDSKTLKAKNVNVLDALGNMKLLTFLSLQGISRVTELPESISNLKYLTILDIRACHNLEKLPDEIRGLENLTHLDMSECYLLDEMPKGLASLTKLQVLSGFVVGDSDTRTSCTLDDLKTFSELRKLSIHTGLNEFPEEKDLRAFNQFKALNKLTIVWGRGSVKTKREDTGKQDKDEGSFWSPEKENIDLNKKEDIDVQKQAKGEKILETGTPNREVQKVDEKKEILVVEEETKTPALKSGFRGDPTKASTSKQVARKSDDKKRGGGKNGEIFEEQKAKSPEQKSDSVHQAAPIGQPSKQDSRRKPDTLTKEGSMISRLLPTKSKSKQEVLIAELPSQLIKLDLMCFPGIESSWLSPRKLVNLEKLYIRGGKFFDLGQVEDLEGDGSEKSKWKVKELRLKYLKGIDMEWRELLELFPNLEYLEKVNCPKLSFFPCDETGVWTKNPIG